jgi:hypothetical protein
VPARGLDEPAAENGAADGAEQHRDAQHRHQPADPRRTRRPRHDRHTERHEHAAAQALEHPVRDELLDRVGGGAQHRAEREQQQGQHVEPLGAEPVGGPATERDHRGQRQGVPGHGPGDLRVRGVELGLEGGQRDAHDGDVEDRHDRAENHHTGDLEHGGVQRLGRRGGLISHKGLQGVGDGARNEVTMVSSGSGGQHPLFSISLPVQRNAGSHVCALPQKLNT